MSEPYKPSVESFWGKKGSRSGDSAPSNEKVLRRLFLLLFSRGRSSRGLDLKKLRASKGRRALGLFAAFALFGFPSFIAYGHPVAYLAVMQHAMTFLFIGSYVVTVASATMFNADEADVLLHRPVTSEQLIRAKTTVLAIVSVRSALIMNSIGLVLGFFAPDDHKLFWLVHAFSSAESGIFCAAAVVLAYQVCLRKVGREKLERVMTTFQVLIAVFFTMGAQIFPRLMMRNGGWESALASPWMKLLPPFWFAALDDAVDGSRDPANWGLAVFGIAATVAVSWLAVVRFSKSYDTGMQALSEETKSQVAKPISKSVAVWMKGRAPWKWFLRDSAAAAAFVLVGTYMTRDRDVKLRLYPSLAPSLTLPIVMLFTLSTSSSGPNHPMMGVAFVAISGCFLASTPVQVMMAMRQSPQWQASDVFMLAPTPGPNTVMRGHLVAILTFICLPAFAICLAITPAIAGWKLLPMMIPGAILMPLFAQIGALQKNMLPISVPVDQGASVRAGCLISILMMIGQMVVAALATFAVLYGLFYPFLALEVVGVGIACWMIDAVLRQRVWRTAD